MLFPALSKSCLQFTRIANYFLHCLNKAIHIEKSITIATSITKKQNRLPHKKVFYLSEIQIQVLVRYYTVWVALEANLK